MFDIPTVYVSGMTPGGEFTLGGLGLNDKLCPPLHLPLLDFSRIIFERKKYEYQAEWSFPKGEL